MPRDLKQFIDHRIAPVRTRPARRRRAAAILPIAVAAVAILAISSCASVVEHQREVAKSYCGSGWPTPEGDIAYPGDPGWPFERHLCDNVAQNGPGSATAMP